MKELQTNIGILLIDKLYNDNYQWKQKEKVLWNLVEKKQLKQVIKAANPEFERISFRKYGEPKLKKPAALKGIKPFTSITLDVAGKRSPLCPVFIHENDVYIKCRDYFSPCFVPPKEDNGAPLNVILKKYFTEEKSKKFIYEDSWGSVILRQEAWLKVNNLVLSLKYFKIPRVANTILEQQKCDPQTELSDYMVNGIWERFWFSLCEQVYKEYHKTK